MSVQKGADLFRKIPIDDLGAMNAAEQNDDQNTERTRGVDAGRDLFNDKKGGAR